jgi:hypothetical protein
MKEMSLREFREIGLLQEINRRLLHPMGLALAAEVYDDGEVHRLVVDDLRDDPEGFCFADDNLDFTREKEENVDKMFNAKRVARIERLGYHVQQTPDPKDK